MEAVGMFLIFLGIVGILIYSVFRIQLKIEKDWDENDMIGKDEDDEHESDEDK